MIENKKKMILWTTVHQIHQASAATVYDLFQFQPFRYEFYQFLYLIRYQRQHHEPKTQIIFHIFRQLTSFQHSSILFLLQTL